MLNVYEQVSRNKFKSTLIIILFIIFISVAAYAIAYAFNLGDGFLLLAVAFSLFSSFASYFWGDKMVLALNHAQPATREDFFDFYTVTENLAMADQLPLPKLYVIDTPAMNAFATGRDPQHAVVVATTGLLGKLNRTELEGVIGHELSHVKNYDIRLMMIVSLLIGTLSILTNLAFRAQWFGGNRRNREEGSGGGILILLGLILAIFAPIIAQLIQLAISRQREYLADASGVKLTRQPQGLINALIKISDDPNIMAQASTATASLYISNPFHGQKLANLFSTHPPIEDRIRALQAML
ncbi:M48 family metalloprotease [Patescibacteria group bacterium]|nr:M48 family metalloprotease [Patescibacteria group bacterium]